MQQNLVIDQRPVTSPLPEQKTYSFKKENGRWYIDLPDYLARGGMPSDLEMAEGAHELLNMMARGKNNVKLVLETEPFDGADVLELDELCGAPKGGGYYMMHTCRSRPLQKRIWLCDVTLFVFGEMPQKIYIKDPTSRKASIEQNFPKL
jgi:hypothetical protein